MYQQKFLDSLTYKFPWPGMHLVAPNGKPIKVEYALNWASATGTLISPQNLAIGTAAAGLVGREGDLFRKVFGWSLLLLLVMCVLAYLQSTPVLGWMVP